MSIKKEYIITKRNVLNEIRTNNMTLQELRFFSIYLSKINPKDISTRIVRFPLSDFQKIMEFDKLKINYITHVTDSLLCKIVRVPLDEKGNYTAFQLFKKCTVNIDETGERYIEIDAHDDALPLMFEFKDKYFTYQLWNALRLKSSNQLRMYEILKQYEKIGERIISVEELKDLLGIKVNEYKRFGDFKTNVLQVCQLALQTNTDIKFSYEPTGKKGKGGKILFLKFTIQKNKDYVDKLSLNKFIEQQTIIDNLNTKKSKLEERLDFMSSACDNEFSNSQIQVLYNLAYEILPYSKFGDDLKLFHFFKDKYDQMIMRSEQTKIHNRFNYLQSLFKKC